jgi:hypothetical protein
VLFSRAVAFWPVVEFVAPFLEAADAWPMAGSEQWRALPNDHPAKWAALLDAARHWALRVETCQQQLADASRAVSAATDWPAISTEINYRSSSAHIPREVA